jgi:COP9 signalosome complex subunit 3
MVESYKKCVLTSLLDTGEPPSQPKYTALPIQRFLKNGVAPYTELTDAFSSRKLFTLRAAVNKHQAAFERDHNLGLAKQCVQALVRRNILRLTQAYLTLSLHDIATATELGSPEEAAAIIVSMVANGNISATIDEKVCSRNRIADIRGVLNGKCNRGSRCDDRVYGRKRKYSATIDEKVRPRGIQRGGA